MREKVAGESYFFHDATCAASFREDPSRYAELEPAQSESPTAPTGAERQFDVAGMTCASCALTVERAVRKIPGVRAVNVNLASNRAHVWGAVDEADVLRAVDEAGYRAAPHASRKPTDHGEERRRVRRLMVLSSALTLPVFVISMFMLSFPGSDWIQAVLTTLVVFGPGLEFHRVALKKARHLGANMDTLVSLGALAAWGGPSPCCLARRLPKGRDICISKPQR